jgi:uncharacterized protein (DUF2249 family)
VIRADERAIEALVGISPKFKRLRNPILRKVMAPRVSLAEAAKIGEVPFQRMAEALEELGFQLESKGGHKDAPPPEDTHTKGDPSLIEALGEDGIHPLDVRSELAKGKDPFPSIMKKLEQVPAGEALKLINSFEPIPLIRKLERKGYGHYVEEKGDELVLTYFRKKGDERSHGAKKGSKGEQVEADPDRMREQYGEEAASIDVRGLEMPEPMMRILEHLRQMPSEEGLYVQHERVPRYLLPELEQEGFSYAMKEVADEEDVRLFIFRNKEDEEG